MKKGKIGHILRVNISIPLSIFLIIGVALVVIFYFAAKQYREDVKFLTLLLGGAAAIYSAYYVGAALRLNVERQKQQASFEILSLLNRPEFVEVRYFLENEVSAHETLSDSDLYEKIAQNTKLDNSVTIVLGTFEDASIAIQQDFVSEDMLYLSIADMVKLNHRGLRGYIEQLRKHRGIASYFVEFEQLCNAWEAGRKLSDGTRTPPLGGVQIGHDT